MMRTSSYHSFNSNSFGSSRNSFSSNCHRHSSFSTSSRNCSALTSLRRYRGKEIHEAFSSSSTANATWNVGGPASQNSTSTSHNKSRPNAAFTAPTPTMSSTHKSTSTTSTSNHSSTSSTSKIKMKGISVIKRTSSSSNYFGKTKTNKQKKNLLTTAFSRLSRPSLSSSLSLSSTANTNPHANAQFATAVLQQKSSTTNTKHSQKLRTLLLQDLLLPPRGVSSRNSVGTSLSSHSHRTTTPDEEARALRTPTARAFLPTQITTVQHPQQQQHPPVQHHHPTRTTHTATSASVSVSSRRRQRATSDRRSSVFSQDIATLLQSLQSTDFVGTIDPHYHAQYASGTSGSDSNSNSHSHNTSNSSRSRLRLLHNSNSTNHHHYRRQQQQHSNTSSTGTTNTIPTYITTTSKSTDTSSRWYTDPWILSS